MATVKGRSFENQPVTLDETEFEGCRFRNCTLVYGGGPIPGFSDCTFERCVWHFTGAAERTVIFLKAMSQAMGAAAGPFMIKHLFVPEKLNMQQSAEGQWQVEVDPGHWITCESKTDADLLAGAAALRFESKPDPALVRQTLAAMKRSGLLAENSFLHRILLSKLSPSTIAIAE